MTNAPNPSSRALRAAVSVAGAAGYTVDDPRVVADSNHTLVWLRPHEIVAKVGRPSADGALLREHEICTALAQAGAPVAPPVPNVDPAREPETGLLVTLWQRFEHGNEDDADPADVGKSLSEVHDALDFYEGELPSFLQKLESSRALLSDEVRTKALSPENRCFLRAAFDALMDELTSCDYRVQRIHGEPHGTNRLTTPEGVRWIDFEGSCVGPVEWDLAFVPQRAFMAFPPPDEPLLELLRTLISARVATLCWERYDVPALRWHAEFHLEQVRSRSPSILPR